MPLKDTGTRYGLLSIVNHWTIAVMIIGMLAFGLYIHDLPKGPEKGELVALHKSFGVLILILGTWRVVWRLISGPPDQIVQMAPWQEMAAKAVHLALLAAIILMPISGYIMSSTGGHPVSLFGLFDLPALPENERLSGLAHQAHDLGGNLLIAIVCLHVLAALKHHFLDKDGTLKRMLGRS